MITFSCHCGHPFSLEDSDAGSLIQCPACKRLNDVPLLSDLGAIDEDGAYKLEEAPLKATDDPAVLARLTSTFTRQHYDALGRPIDLRPTQEEMLRGPESPDELASAAAAPKYDPFTGELIKPIEVKSEPPPGASPAIPLARVAHNASIKRKPHELDIPSPLEAAIIPLRLFKPINLIVMAMILGLHALSAAIVFAFAAGFLIVGPFWLAVKVALMAHYSNVVDETGPTNRNELPTPLRSVDLRDDIFVPLFQLSFALLLSYGPAALFDSTVRSNRNMPVEIVLSVGLTLLAAGTALFPAVYLTLVTSGSVANVRPDRIIGVVRACGAEYAFAVVVWMLTIPLYVGGIALTSLIAINTFNVLLGWIRPVSLPPWYVAWAMLAAGVYLMHMFCWHLGTLYRKHHDRFPWLYQRRLTADGKSYAPPLGFQVGRPGKRTAASRATSSAGAAPLPVEPIRVLDEPR